MKIEIIGPPKIDRIIFCQDVEKPLIAGEKDRVLWRIASKINHEYFGFDDQDKISEGFKDIYERDGYSTVEERKRITLNVKGQACSKRNNFWILKDWIRRNKREDIEVFVRELDIAIPYKAKKVGVIFREILNGYWFKRASADSFFQPELMTKASAGVSTASYFKSRHFFVLGYSLLNKMQDQERQLSRLKSNSRKRKRLESSIWHFKRLYREQEVYRFELRILGKQKCDGFLEILDRAQSEEEFCFEVLRRFWHSHPLWNPDTQKESKILKNFFEKKNHKKESRK